MTPDDGNTLTAALECAARGWHVFPCGPDKQPLTKHGFKDASCDPEQVRALWAPFPYASIGIATGASGLIVVDLDCKKGKPGLDEWHKLRDRLGPGIDATTLVDTPSGGTHVYYRANGHRVGSTTERLAPGIDTRAEGGYVIAAGSPGYLYVDDHGPDALGTMPESLAKLIVYAPTKPAEQVTGVIPEGRRDSALASIAGTMRRRGLSEEAIYAALAAENKASCRPPLADDQVRKIARSIARKPAARPVQEPEEPPEDDLHPEPVVPRGSVFIDWTTFWNRDHSEEEWIYPDVLARGRGHSIYAVHKAGKSLLMLYMAAQIATSPMPVVVVYLDYEMTEDDIFDRLDDMGYGPDTDFARLRYALLPTLPPLDAETGTKALMHILDGVQAEWPEHHVVVVIDTISRAVKGEENSADTFRDFYAHTGIQLKRRGITWVRLDHGGKTSEQGQRGSSGKGDDVDVVWKLTSTEHGVKLHRELARMSWVPENVTLGLFENPLRYMRIAGDWPEGTGQVAVLLERLGLPLVVTTRDAQKALKAAGEGRRRNVVCAAVRLRQDQAAERGGNHSGSGTRAVPGCEESEQPEPHPLFETESGSGTAGNTVAGQVWEPGGVTYMEPPPPAPADTAESPDDFPF